MLPLRWYLQILFDQAARGSPSADSAGAFAWVAGLAVGYFALALWRLIALLHARSAPETGVRSCRRCRAAGLPPPSR